MSKLEQHRQEVKGLMGKNLEKNEQRSEKLTALNENVDKQKEKFKVEQVRQASEEVKEIMAKNLEKTEQRSEKLTELNEKADKLKEKSYSFKKTAVTAKKKQRNRWLQSLKEKKKMIAIVTGLFIIIITVVIIMEIFKSNESPVPQQGFNSQTTTMAPGK